MTTRNEREQYMVKCDFCKRIVHFTDNIHVSYCGCICEECRETLKEKTSHLMKVTP